VPHWNPQSFAKACAKASSWDVIYNSEEDGFFGLTTVSTRKVPMLDTPRPVAFSILELSKARVLRAHYDFFHQKYIKEDRGKLHFTDTDSLAYLLQTESLFEYLLTSPDVEFDMAPAIPNIEALKLALPSLTDEKCAEKFAEIQSGAGRLGAFKIESGVDCITEFVGLAPKMYSMQLQIAVAKDDESDSDGEKVVVDAITKGKGVPTSVLKKNATHAVYRKMLFEPHSSTVKFRKLQSFKHQVCGLEVNRSMLTALQDKTYQLSTTESRPLGHWRNREELTKGDSPQLEVVYTDVMQALRDLQQNPDSSWFFEL